MATRDTILKNPSKINIEESAHDSLSVHWSAVFAGLFVSFLVYFMLMSLGMAVGGNVMREAIQNDDSMRSIALGAGLWSVASVVIALFSGGYASGRVSGMIATRVGYTQGAVITALFLIALISQVSSTLGYFTRNLTSIMTMTPTISSVMTARNPRLTGLIEDKTQDLKLKLPIYAVATRLSRQLLQGDVASAQAYLAIQAGISQAQAQVRMNAINAAYKDTLADISEKASQATSRLGLSAFITILLGSLSAMLGGGTGALVNMRKPLDRVDERALRGIPAYT